MSKYISIGQIRESINELSKYHVFFGTTFLVLKRTEVPINKTINISLDAENKLHLTKYFRVHPKSNYFFIPFKKRSNEDQWRKPKYASTSLQAINTQAFAPALLHKKNENNWGWNENYLSFLTSKLPKGQKLPLLHFAVWFEREEVLQDSETRVDLIQRFVRRFNLNENELSELFDIATSSSLPNEEAFQPTVAKWEHIIEGFGIPDDVPVDSGATLQYLAISGIGPARQLSFEPGERLNVITGDNGLGKTFLLDLVWWALTQEWVEHMMVPLEPVATPPEIKFAIAKSPEHGLATASFNSKTYSWRIPSLSAVPGLVVYARVDGSFAVWDPANPAITRSKNQGNSSFVSFSRECIWDGDKTKIEGLLRDWARWQTRASEFPIYQTFQKVIQRLKPPDLGEISIGKPQRLRGKPIEIPTLVHPYGTVPIIYESAGIKRILALAYLIVWAWEEHKIQTKQEGKKEERQMVILIDEAEAHLHPRWQRVLLKALLGIAQDLHEELSIQYFIASHSPMILASAEPIWDTSTDKLFHLQLNEKGKVLFDEIPFELRGTADSWLRSPSFDELYPGSDAAEFALRQAKSLLEKTDITPDEIKKASKSLVDHIAAEDPFWLRWIIFARRHGVEV